MIPLFGEACSLAAAVVWSGSTTMFTLHGKSVPAQNLNLFKNTIAFVCLAITAILLGERLTGTSTDFIILGLSGIIGLSVGDTALFAALKRLGAQLTSSLQCLAPPISALVASISLGEELSQSEWIGLTVTMSAICGVILSSRGTRNFNELPKKELLKGLFFALLSASCQGVAIVMARAALQKVDVIHGTMIRICPAMIVLIGMILVNRRPLSWRGQGVPTKTTIYLGVASFAGTYLGLILMSTGAKFAKAGIASALTSTYPLWIIPIAGYFLKEQIRPVAIGFTFLAVLGIILMMA